MAISVVCECGKKLQVKDELAGKRGKCPACGKVLAIPSAASAPAAVAPAPSASNPTVDFDPFGTSGGGLDLGALGPMEGSADPFASAGAAGDTLAGSAAPLGGGGFAGGAGGFAGGMGAAPGYGKPAAKKPAAASDKPFFTRWYVLAGGGVLAVLVLAGAGLGLAFAFGAFGDGGGGPPVAANPRPNNTLPTPPANTPTTPPPANNTPAAAKPLALKVVSAADLTLAPGATAFFDVAVERGGVTGPLQVSIEGLSDKVGTAPVQIADGQSATKIVLLAAADVAEGSQSARIVITAAGGKIEQPLAVTVKKINPPALSPISTITLSPGGRGAAAISVERNGHAGSMQVQVGGLSDKVTAAPLEIPADQSTGKLEFTVAADAPNAKLPLRVAVTVGSHSAETQFELSVEKVSFKLLQMPVVWLAPEEKTTVEVKVERGGYQGPIELSALNLPENVSASPTAIPAGQTSVKMEISAAADAKDRVRSAKVVGTAGGATTEKFLVVRVKKVEGSLLPEVAIDPALGNLLKRGSFGGRLSVESKQALRELFGGTSESEAAVMAGLKWLDKHQAADGHWSLNAYNTFAQGCDCEIAMEDKVQDNNTAATALGVLPFLGAGITPSSSPDSPRDLKKYQKTVKSAIEYLAKHQILKEGDDNGNLGGGMYAHAIGTIALCEVYALTNDKDLKVPAQRAVRYLLEAQHRPTGGWGYGPKQPGDTSVVGWVFLGIRSGQMSGMPIDPGHLTNASKFLDSTSKGPEGYQKSRYSYKPDTDATPALTAAGLLSRQYLGWQPTQRELPEGCKYLMENLPPESATQVGRSYYYYYATQVLHHMEGKDWDLWNHFMREHLVRTQEKSGHKQGSWSPEGSDWGSAGGRLYTTSLSLLTLEVSYRHLPLYRKIPKPVE